MPYTATASALINTAKLLIIKHQYSEAINLLVEVIKNDPGNPHGYYWFAVACLGAGNNKYASTAFNKALVLGIGINDTTKDLTNFIRSEADEGYALELIENYFLSIVDDILSYAKQYKQLTAVWDFRSQPYSIGDAVILYQLAWTLAQHHSIDLVDIKLFVDPSLPARPSFAALGVTQNNYFDHILKLVPAFLIGEKISDFQITKRFSCIEAASKKENTLYWPPFHLLESMLDLNVISMKFLTHYFRKYGFLPELRLRPSLIQWAETFISNHGQSNTIPIAIQLRKAKEYNPTRNSNIEAWLTFFAHCASRYPVTFFLICAPAEIDLRLRNYTNVIVVKDRFTTVDQDLALIKACSAFMGISSGPATVANFGTKPYSILNVHLMDGMKQLLTSHDWGYSYEFAHNNQRLIPEGIETFEILTRELSLLLTALKYNETSFASYEPYNESKLQL